MRTLAVLIVALGVLLGAFLGVRSILINAGTEVVAVAGRSSPQPVRDESRTFTERLLENYDTSDPRIDLDGLVGPGVAKDGIPALTNPVRTAANRASYPSGDDRVVAVEIDDEAVAYPLLILNWHEIVNDLVGDVPIAVTYCPLCDSVSVFDRRLTVMENGESSTQTLEFGVSGLLYNSNVVMYERSTMGLWSQVYMQAVTGPHAGRDLRHRPVRMMTFVEFRAKHPNGEVLTTETGHQREYERNPYARYFTSDRLFMEMEFGDELPPKTLGLGVRAEEFTAFVTAEAAMDEPVRLETPLGEIVIKADADAGIYIEETPNDARIVQTFYHSWSAFYPGSRIIAAEGERRGATRAPDSQPASPPSR
jgi:hypothetical protein